MQRSLFLQERGESDGSSTELTSSRFMAHICSNHTCEPDGNSTDLILIRCMALCAAVNNRLSGLQVTCMHLVKGLGKQRNSKSMTYSTSTYIAHMLEKASQATSTSFHS